MRLWSSIVVLSIWGGTFAGARAESSVVEHDSIPYVMISNLTVAEGNSGLTPFTATLTPSNRIDGLTVRVTATPGTASESDYIFTPTEVTFGADAGVQTVSGFIVGDTEVESDETFTLTATAVAGDSGVAPRMYSSGGIVVIKNDDYPREPTIYIESVTVLEGDTGTSIAAVRVVLDPVATTAVAVSYRSQDGTAINGEDYYAVEGILNFAPGQSLQTIPIEILGDTTPEPDEVFTVILSSSQTASIGTARANVVIVNDDGVVPGLDASPAMDGSENAFNGAYDAGGSRATTDTHVTGMTDAWFGGDSRGGNGIDATKAASPRSGCTCSLGTSRRPSRLAFLIGILVAICRFRSPSHRSRNDVVGVEPPVPSTRRPRRPRARRRDACVASGHWM